MQDMLGREFDIEKDENGNEVWRSTEHPEFTFICISEDNIASGQKVDLNDVLSRYGVYSSSEANNAIKQILNSVSKDKNGNLTQDSTGLLDVMPVTNKMFVPLINNVFYEGAICNAAIYASPIEKYGTGLFPSHYIELKHYNSKRNYMYHMAIGNISHGIVYNSTYGCQYTDPENILFSDTKEKIAIADSEIEKFNIIKNALDKNEEMNGSFTKNHFLCLMSDYVDVALLILEKHPEQAQNIFDSFNSIKQSDADKEYREYNEKFYKIMAEKAPQVFIDNASLIPSSRLIECLPYIATENQELVLEAFNAMPSLKENKGVSENKEMYAFYTFLDMQLPNVDKEKMLTTLLNDKVLSHDIGIHERILTYLEEYIKNNSRFSDEFCEAIVRSANDGSTYAWCMDKCVCDVVEKQPNLSVGFCKELGKLVRRKKGQYTGKYLQALKKLPNDVDKMEFYKDFVHILATYDHHYIEKEEISAAINYLKNIPEKLSPEFCDYLIETGKDMYSSRKKNLQPIFLRVLNEDISYYYKHKNVFDDDIFVQNVAITDHSLIPEIKNISKENFDAFAKIYEEYASRDDNFENLVGQKNVMLDKDKTAKIMDIIKDKISKDDYYSNKPSKLVQVWLVKNAKKYPNLVGDILKTKELPYVEMCIKHIEDPEKENIASLLNRLEAKEKMQYIAFYENRSEDNEQKFDSKKYQESLTYEDFQDARDFVARRDMCMRVTGGYKELSYDMAEAGIDDFRTAKRVDQLFVALNERPNVYNSDYNSYYPEDLLPIAKFDKLQDWMYPVMVNAIQKGGLTVSEERLPSEKTLFDCCKAWKICPEMPQKLAKFVGAHSLKGRMLAGAIFDKMCEEGNTTPQEWRENKELHQKFYEELDRAQKMPREKALKQYIPNTPVNRKHLVGMAMEEKGIENTRENFKSLYRQMREKGVFDKMLANPKEAKTTFSSRLLVESARRKHGRK
ncbi:MAG: hypothetical protein IKC10_04145 [Alphaproteobacteria bacterium]|nr:hypothetical protein [Alphaproteobacteria bacterium]